MEAGMVRHPKARKLYGRARGTRKANVVVFCDGEGYTCIQRWTKFARSACLKLTLEEARVLHRALDQYLADV